MDKRGSSPVARPSCASLSPFWDILQLGKLPTSHPCHLFLQWFALLLFSAPPPCRDNQAYVKTTCSFVSRQPISDPIKPKSAIVPPSKCLKSACARERGWALYPANHSWHSCQCCHGPGSEVVKTESMSWLGDNSKSLKRGALFLTAPLVSQCRE